MARRDFPRSTFDQINVTPLIDTLFFLLIIFMVTAPLLEYTVEVSPPQMNADKMNPTPDSKIINVKSTGEIIWDRHTISEEELVRALHSLKDSGKDVPLYLRADSELKYGKVMGIMKLVRGAGFPNVLLVMEEEPK